MISRTRLLPWLLAAAAALAFTASSALAVPGDPFTGASSRFDEPPQQGRSINLGDWGVAEQRGAAIYTVPLAVPLGRLGMEPHLALRYSSHSPLRGGLAAGWMLDVPSVMVDRSLGEEAAPTFWASLGSVSGRLVEVPEQSPFGGRAYRVEFDDSFTRFFNPPDGALSTWTALTSDGVRHEFGNEAGSRSQEAGLYDAGTRWLLTREVDSHGNTVHYVWSKSAFGSYVDYSLQRIEYTANAAAGLAPHAKVEFTYAPADVCVGSSLPVGAAPAGGSRVIDGARRLVGITTSVRDRPGAAWRVARIVSLEYRLRSSSLHFPTRAPVHPPAGLACTQTPLRYLTALRMTAYDPRGAATTLPPITFTYNARLQGGLTSLGPAPFETRTLASPGLAHYGNQRGATGTLLDLDSDGIPDRISVREEQRVCTLVWQRGIRGGGFEREVRKSPLPTAPWTDEVAGPDGVYRPRLADERCTLNGQVTYRYREVFDPEFKEKTYVPARGVLSYHFMDFTGDGRVDLLTNVWAGVAHETFVPPCPPFNCLFRAIPGALSPLGRLLAQQVGYPTIPPIQMTPEVGRAGLNTGYVWRVYRNAGDPVAVVSSPLPDAPFATLPIKVATPGWTRFPEDRCDPEPLPPSANDDLLDRDVVPSVSIQSLTDLDGDGFLDLVDAANIARGLSFDGRWCVWFGTGTPAFSGPYLWAVPRISLLVREAGFKEETIDRFGERHIKRTTGAALQDMSGDGLPDLVVQTSDRLLKAYLNTGSGFRLEPISLGVYSPVEIMQTDYSYNGSAPNNPVLDGNRGYRLRLLDVDGDRLPDLVSTSAPDDDIAAAGRVYVRFNAGDHFNSPVEVPTRWAEARRLLTFNKGEWQLATDFVDANGDGLADLASWASDGSSLTFSVSPGLPQAPDLLRTVENGRGLRVSFSYAPSTDPAAVSWNHSARNTPVDLPQPTWVVNALTVSGGFRTPDMVTRFTYADPRLLSPSAYRGVNERVQFVGMGSAERDVRRSGGLPARETTRRYAYDENGAPDGRVVEERLYRREGDVRRLQRSTVNEWERKPLFAGRTYATTLRSTITRTCLPDASETACTSQTENVGRSEETWTPKNCGSATQALYVSEIRREGIGLTAGDQDRRTLYDPLIVCGGVGQPDYRVLVERTQFEQAEPGSGGSVFEKRGDTQVTYDDRGMPIQTDEKQDADTIATTKRIFDAATGNLLRLMKPDQAAAGGSGKATVHTYDAQGLYIQKSVDELGHTVLTRHDLATGSLLDRRGPNAVRLPSGKTALERETWRVDGLGRTVAHTQSFDDRVKGYVLRTVTKTRYFDATLPNRIRTEKLRDLGGSIWVTSDRTADGLGRTLVETQQLDGGRKAVTTYTYDADGNVRAIEVPDPRRDDGARVRYTYAYDGLGRLASLTRPDDSGIRIVYAGLNTTVSEIAKDGSGSTRRQIFDALGRLVAVHELYANAEPAVTRYRYDGRDNVIGITDADGNVTRLAYDWASRRIAITRGDRTWRFSYDRNGNLVSEVRPAPAGTDPALHSVTTAFDDLDRITTVSFADIRDSAAPDNKTLATVRYVYDEGKDGIGRLHSVALPFGQIRYSYDARGLATSEQRSFALSGMASVSDSQRVQRSYNALGQLTQSVWDDGQRWRIGYDRRGLVANVDWYAPAAHAWKHVAAFKRSLAGQPRLRESSIGQVRHYSYDALGRVVRDDIVARRGSPPIATRSYAFTDSGDLRAVSGETNGISAVANYSYDAQHRLTAASGPNGYAAALTYSPAGNVLTANVRWNGSSDTRNVRYEYGTRDPQAVDRLVNLTSGTTFARFNYDLAGNMVRRSTSAGAISLHWDGLDQLRVVNSSATGRDVYFYDQTGARMLAVSRTSGVRFWFGESETQYTLDGTQIRRYLHLSDGGSMPPYAEEGVKRMDAGGTPADRQFDVPRVSAALARVENGAKIELQYTDALQNLILALDAQGRTVASFFYGPLGEVLRATGEQNHRRQFNSKENDAVTGLRYYGRRYYDPLALRWNSADPRYRFSPDIAEATPARLNLYEFSLNNPLRYFDPDGRNPWELLPHAWDLIVEGKHLQEGLHYVEELGKYAETIEARKLAELQKYDRQKFSPEEIKRRIAARLGETAAGLQRLFTQASQAIQRTESYIQDLQDEREGILEALEAEDLTEEEQATLEKQLQEVDAEIEKNKTTLAFLQQLQEWSKNGLDKVREREVRSLR